MITGGFIFVLGLIFGSFLNAWEYRIETKKSLWDRSFCPKCKRPIAWYDNIPLLSWFVLQGKCRKCHKPISIQYPAVELITGLVFLSIWHYSSAGAALQQWLNGISSFEFQISNQFPMIEFLIFLLIIAYFLLLILVAIHDAKTKYVLTRHVYIAALVGLATSLLRLSEVPAWSNIYPYLLATFIPFGIFWIVAKLSKERAMGYGDADIALAIGLFLGWPLIMPSYYFAFITGALYGIYILLSKKGKLKSEIPLGPFLIAGVLFAYLYGAQIIDWYVKILLGK